MGFRWSLIQSLCTVTGIQNAIAPTRSSTYVCMLCPQNGHSNSKYLHQLECPVSLDLHSWGTESDAQAHAFEPSTKSCMFLPSEWMVSPGCLFQGAGQVISGQTTGVTCLLHLSGGSTSEKGSWTSQLPQYRPREGGTQPLSPQRPCISSLAWRLSKET